MTLIATKPIRLGRTIDNSKIASDLKVFKNVILDFIKHPEKMNTHGKENEIVIKNEKALIRIIN